MLLSDREWRVAYHSDSVTLVRDFYVPVLQAASHYSREAGYFSSTSLAIAAEGFSALFSRVRRGEVAKPAVRLLIGAQLPAPDRLAMEDAALAETVSRELADAWEVPEDLLIRERLSILAWLLREGYLEIRIGIPRDVGALYHPKVGIIRDDSGNYLTFNGSLNESARGWTENVESFHVFASWRSGEGAHVATDREAFERRWEGRSPQLTVIPLSDALAARLLEWVPEPDWEPSEEERLITAGDSDEDESRDEVPEQDGRRTLSDKARALLDQWEALSLEEKTYASEPVNPWPHQRAVLHDALGRRPVRRLLCDEVGLGKTVEVSLVVRALALSDEARTVLFAVPAGLMPQWQEQLWEKGGWEVPIYDEGELKLRDGSSMPAPTKNPLDGRVPWLICSKSLLARKDRRQWLDESVVWDVLVVDEAHNLRRQAPTNIKRPKFNQLLQTFRGLRERGKFRHALLLTATPMQMHPIELYDLLQVLGVDGPWAEETWFRKFYDVLDQIRQGDWEELPWLLGAVNTTLETYGQGLSPTVLQTLSRQKQWLVEKALQVPGLMASKVVNTLEPSEMTFVAASHTPLQYMMSRHTRQLLKAYHQRGITKDPLPERRVEDVVVAMTPEEEQIYQDIESYFIQVYRNDEWTKKGLGFMKTLYLRRLTSSLTAAKKSLERRAKRLSQGINETFDFDDLELVDIDADPVQVPAEPGYVRESEIEQIRMLLHRLEQAPPDSKYLRLRQDMDELLRRHRSILVFTQYTDTLDDLRERLLPVFGTRLATYSGRGGEYWTGSDWAPISKTELLETFRRGDTVRILLCTDAASEGLDLQTCAAMINYDMPWNPMRVEQRIGRIDRIGQSAPVIEILNYYYPVGVDRAVYGALRQRLNLFVAAVGPMQAILGKVESVVEQVFLEPSSDRRQFRISQEIERLQKEQERLAIAAKTLDITRDTVLTVAVDRIEAWRSTLIEWLELYHRITGFVSPWSDHPVARISVRGEYRWVTADPATYRRLKSEGVGWFSLDTAEFMVLMQTWATMQ
ncbi:helicase domain protein [Sulfobacillus acidophilus TPY]|uniref:Helicase domain-containing protein n=1 Tax=Sulfobacillus acidophilus (strain ATCC 700253 / DSM 10332 / NAL) TaxID=679936 RepID=G8TVK1_SULAD|nr:helicase domain protein [Sulfobacillus acidophilus TPY]AEW03640.1 helicase domain-containing protein [Sulfobacillus acidophilus DSM 10332]